MLLHVTCICQVALPTGMSSPSKSSNANASISDARVIYQGINDEGWSKFEEDYTSLLLKDRNALDEAAMRGPEDADTSFAAALSAARTSACFGHPEERKKEVLARYKRVIRMRPRFLAAWREIAACYELLGCFRASLAALKAGLRANRSGGERASSIAAPLHLHSAVIKLGLPGRAGEGLESVGEAFRAGRGGAVGYLLRGLLNARLGKDVVASNAFRRAREVDPSIADLVERVSSLPRISLRQ